MKKKKCYIYTRVSTAAQTEGYSLDAQKERIRQFAEYKDLEIAGEYCDAGKSGHSIKGRPSFMEMLDDITAEKDGISFVLVYKLSRFGRNAADVLKSMQLLMDYDVDLVCVEDSIDSSTQGGRLTLAILSAVAEIERENINVQFLAGKMQKILDGGWSGGPLPYGYRNVDKQPEVVPSEAEIVGLMDSDEKSLYFLTAKGKGFYDRLKKREFLALTAMKGEDTMSSVAVSIRGKVRELGYDKIPELFEKNPYMRKIYPTEESMQALTVFQIYEGSGEWFDLSKKPIERASFTFGGVVKKAEGYFITDKCIGCGSCVAVCPQNCIIQDEMPFVIEQEHCLHCGNCMTACHVDAVERR